MTSNMAKSTAAGGSTPNADPSFEDLLADIIENPEQVLDKKISPEQVLELQKLINPYAYVMGDAGNSEHKRAVATSCTNLRADYLQRFTMTSLVGFLFRMFNEWEVPVESRRWISKAGIKRAKREEAARRAVTPFTPDDILQRTEALRELAQIAKDAATEAEEASEKARKADDEFRISKVDGNVADLSHQKKTLETLLKKADGALAKARGMQYAATFELRKFGLEADDCIDAVATVARQHPEVAAVIDLNPVRRAVPGQMEMPANVAKEVISDFLRAQFEYNPDAHVRSVYDELVINKTTAEIEVEGLGKVPTDTADPTRLPLSVVRAATPDIKKETDREAVEALTVSREAYNAATYMLRNEQAARALGTALEAPDRFKRYLLPIPTHSAARSAVDVIPPQDAFHRWRYYTEVNYEELRTATEAIYHEKPDLDWALIIYEFFEGTSKEVDDAFEHFRNQHQDEVISDIKGIDFGSWTLLGDFKENRSKISFYNKHTDVLKRILDRHAEDKILGQDLMRNRVRQLKAKNIKETGPDAPGLSEYKGQNAGQALASMGAERVINREEMVRLERAKGDIRAAKELEVLDQCRTTIDDLSAAAKVRELKPEEDRRLQEAQADLIRAQEMIEVPSDAIQVDIWTHDSSTGAFDKSKFYTKTEAPKHIAEIQQEQAASASGYIPNTDFSGSSDKAAMSRHTNPSVAQNTRVEDLAPFAQHELAREVAATKLANIGEFGNSL